VTVLCLVELDGTAAADVSLRALTFARALAEPVALPDASATPSASQAPAAPAAEAPEGQASPWMWQKAGYSEPSATSMPGPGTGEGGPPATGGAAETDSAAGTGGAVGASAGDSAIQADGVMASSTGFGGPASGQRAGVAAVVFGAADAVPVAELSAYGVTDAYGVESPQLTGYAPEAWARALAGLADELSATAVVAAATDHGSEVMAHLGAITGLPVAANCASAATAAPGTFRLVRHRWAGSLLEDSVLEAQRALLTVAVDAVAPAAGGAFVATSVHAWQPALGEGDLRVVAVESAERSTGASLATARVVVGGGRGVGGPEGFGALEELAGLLGGVVGVSRVVTSEGWRPHKQQVGQTGTRISPELYLACGISGAIQHMAGCLSAKHIVAVNTDPDAPIISHADYAVIGDLKEVIPALVAAIRARDGSEQSAGS
jgi:electron transfer flavoprotein alpha subunit